MRELNAFVQSRLAQEPLKYYGLVDLELTSGYFYFSNLPYDLTIGGQLYLSDVGIISHSSPRQSATVDREAFNFSFVDVSGAFKDELVRSVAGNNLRLRLGFFNDDETPNTEEANLLVSYEGYIDAVSYNNDFENAIISVEGSSPMADLGLVKTMITSPDGMDEFNEDDTSFDKIIDKNESTFKWGKT